MDYDREVVAAVAVVEVADAAAESHTTRGATSWIAIATTAAVVEAADTG